MGSGDEGVYLASAFSYLLVLLGSGAVAAFLMFLKCLTSLFFILNGIIMVKNSRLK